MTGLSQSNKQWISQPQFSLFLVCIFICICICFCICISNCVCILPPPQCKPPPLPQVGTSICTIWDCIYWIYVCARICKSIFIWFVFGFIFVSRLLPNASPLHFHRLAELLLTLSELYLYSYISTWTLIYICICLDLAWPECIPRFPLHNASPLPLPSIGGNKYLKQNSWNFFKILHKKVSQKRLDLFWGEIT